MQNAFQPVYADANMGLKEMDIIALQVSFLFYFEFITVSSILLIFAAIRNNLTVFCVEELW